MNPEKSRKRYLKEYEIFNVVNVVCVFLIFLVRVLKLSKQYIIIEINSLLSIMLNFRELHGYTTFLFENRISRIIISIVSLTS